MITQRPAAPPHWLVLVCFRVGFAIPSLWQTSILTSQPCGGNPSARRLPLPILWTSLLCTVCADSLIPASCDHPVRGAELQGEGGTRAVTPSQKSFRLVLSQRGPRGPRTPLRLVHTHRGLSCSMQPSGRASKEETR